MNWLDLTRAEAEKKSLALPFPEGKEENFRFTAISPEDFKRSGIASAALKSPKNLDEGEIALLTLSAQSAEQQGASKGFTLSGLQAAVDSKFEVVRLALSESVFPADKFAQMAEARWKNGAFFYVPAGQSANTVRVLQESVDPQEYFRHLIVLEQNSSATFIQESVSDDEMRACTELSTVRLAKGAHLHWVLVQRHGCETIAMNRQQIILEKGASLEITVVQLGSKKTQVRQEVILQGDQSSLKIAGAVRGSGEQHFDFWTEVNHRAQKTTSALDYFFVMDGKSRAVFNGLLHIEKTGQETEAYQKAKSLLLGTKSTVHAIPKLIIQTDAVKCSHGASVASVNPEQVHYLQSRGISKSEAEQMIIRGFTEPVFTRIPTEALYARVEEEIGSEGLLQ